MKNTVTLQSRIGKEYIKISSLAREINRYEEYAAKISEKINILKSNLFVQQQQQAADAVKSYTKIDSINRGILKQQIRINEAQKQGQATAALEAVLKTKFQLLNAERQKVEKLFTDDEVRKLALLGYQHQVATQQAKTLEGQRATIIKANDEIDVTNKKFGILGNILKSVSKIPFLGQFIHVDRIMDQMDEAAEKGGSRLKVLGAGFKAMGTELKRVFLDPLSTGLALAGIIAVLVKGAFDLDKNITDTANSLAISKDASQALYKNFEDISINTKKVNENLSNSLLSISNQGKALNELNASFGTSIMYGDQQVQDQIFLTLYRPVLVSW